MTEQNYDLTDDIINRAFVNVLIKRCIGSMINNPENSNYGSCVSMFPRPGDRIFQLFCQPYTLDKAKIIIFESSSNEHEQSAFMDSGGMYLAVAIADNSVDNVSEDDFIEKLPPKVMQNYDRDDLWRRFQADYAKWLESIPEEYRPKE